MKSKTIYICECCGKEYQRSTDAYKCEEKCLGMNHESYKRTYTKPEYNRILHSLYFMYKVNK